VSESGPDLVVAGAGGGLAGALRAAELGLDVLVVDVDEHFAQASNTAMSTAMIPGPGSRWQREAGIDDSPDRFVADVLRKTHGEGDEGLARVLGEIGAPLVEWLADSLELPLSLVTEFDYPGHTARRCHTVPGRSGRVMLAHLVSRARRHERIELMVPARLVEVRFDAAGAVRAVVIESPAGREEVETPAVLLATSGFGADPDLVAEHIPQIAGAVYHGSAAARGDALRIGREAGAAVAFLDAYQGHGALAMPAATLVGWATVMHGAVLVDRHGRRFGDETMGYSEYAAQILAHADGEAWIVLDQRIDELCRSFQDYQDTCDSGAVRWADTPGELGRQCGIDPAGLAQTLEEVTGFADGAQDDAFGRRTWSELSAPWAAIAVRPALFHTQGGLCVDHEARVLSEQGDVIVGLYASGGAAAGISGHGAAGYLAGNGLLPALGLAFIAAGSVAHRLTGEQAGR
jgi:fumarate reductase flavoprotein subunit